MRMTVNCVLEVGDTAKDKCDSIRFLVLCKSWNLGGGLLPPSATWLRLRKASALLTFIMSRSYFSDPNLSLSLSLSLSVCLSLHTHADIHRT